MFIKKLTIKNNNSNIIIREINFKQGLNLIIDKTDTQTNLQKTGNSVGKTTVLKLIDYCLGSDGKGIYSDTEFNKQPNTMVEKFLKAENITITLELIKNFDNLEKPIIISRNFLTAKKKIQQINNIDIPDDKKFKKELSLKIFEFNEDIPTFRQIISKNIRDNKDKLTHTVRTLGTFLNATGYEALHLFWLGLHDLLSQDKKDLSSSLKKEKDFLRSLEKKNSSSPSFIDQKITLLNTEIAKLTIAKEKIISIEHYSQDIVNFNLLKNKIATIIEDTNNLNYKKQLINDSINSLQNELSNINIYEIKSLYTQAKTFIPNLQKTFEDSLDFHNSLIKGKINFLSLGLPEIISSIEKNSIELEYLNQQKSKNNIELNNNDDCINDIQLLEKIITKLNDAHEQKGRLIEQQTLLLNTHSKINSLQKNLDTINNSIHSKDSIIQERITLFNSFFSPISNEIYNEQYLLSTHHTEHNNYELTVTNFEGNPSIGKKKGQIAAFDFAYIAFADSLKIKCLHFIAHDQLETVHHNQLITISKLANSKNIQYILPILEGIIPKSINPKEFVILELSQSEKLLKLS